MGVNHLAHFHLTSLLLPRMLASAGANTPPPRVVVLSSSAHAMSNADTMADASLGMQVRRWHMRLPQGPTPET